MKKPSKGRSVGQQWVSEGQGNLLFDDIKETIFPCLEETFKGLARGPAMGF